MNTLAVALISIAILYFIFAIFKKVIERALRVPICAICGAVSLTWAALLALYFMGYSVDMIVVAILMGQSTAGSMYKLEKVFARRGLSNFWVVRLAVILFGTVGVYFVLTESWNLLLLVIIAAVVFAALSLFFVKVGGEHHAGGGKSGLLAKAALELKERMKHCC